MFTPKIRFYLLVCLLYTACRNDRLQTATYAPSIEMALQRAASTAAQTDYRGAITLLQAVLKTLPAPVQRDTPTDKVYHKLGVYYQLWSVEQQGFALQQRCADTSITFFKQALEIRQRILGNHWMTCKTRLNIGTLFKDFQNDYFSAQAHLEQSLFTAQTDTVGMAKHAPFLEAEILYNLGVALVKLGDYDLAQAHAVRADSLYKALKVLKESDDSNDFQNYINNLLNLGDIYAVHQPPMALECFNALQNMVQKRQIPTDIALTAVLNRGIALRRQQKWHLAELDLQKAQRMATVRADSANIHIELAKLYLDTKAYAMAESHALSAMRLRQEYPKGHPVWAEIHTVLGAIYLKINLLEKAKKAFESAVGEDLGNSTVPAVWQLEALSQLADLQAKTDLEGAAKSYQRLSDGLYARKSFLQTDAAKLNWTQQARDIFSKSISLNRQLHEKTGQMAYLNQILTDMERSKAVLMSEMIQDARIGQYADVPNSVRKAEHALRLSVAQAERNLNNNPSLFQQNQMDLSKKYQDWQSFVQVLGQKYPKYFHFKHQQNHAVAVADVQKKLPKATGLIHYYLNNNVLHILAMDKSMAKVYELPLTAAFDTAFHRYQRIISQSKWDWKQNALFSQASYQLYQYLLAKPLSDLQHCTTLITVP
ncbi:MAG: MalT-like region, partial [Bacteroidota bacterium]